MAATIHIADYDPDWPRRFEEEALKIRSALGDRALRIEHVGSTAIPDLPAKPIIDIVLLVADSAVEPDYAPALENAGYHLRIREPAWFEHRMFKGPQDSVNLHVFSNGCREVDRMLQFRDWLRSQAADRDLYVRTKRALARQAWNCTQDYADAKTAVVQEILALAEASIMSRK